MKRLLIALLLALLPATALAQQFNTIPDKSVIGRMGSGSGSGPSQAIPFGTLQALFTGGSITPALVGGSTDNTAALNVAITQCANNGGGNITIPAGNYSFATGITLSSSGCNLVGTGIGSTLTYTGTGIGITIDGGISNVNLANLQIVSSGTTNILVQVSNFNNNLILENVLLNGGGTQLQLTSTNSSSGGSYSVRCLNTEFNGAANAGLKINPAGAGLSQAHDIIGCDFFGFVQNAISIVNSAGIKFIGGRIERHLGTGATSNAIHIDNSSHITFDKVLMEDDSNNYLFDIGNNVADLNVSNGPINVNVIGGTHTSAGVLNVSGTGCQLITLYNNRVSIGGTIGPVFNTVGCQVYARATHFQGGTATWGFASTASASIVNIDGNVNDSSSPTTFTSGTQQVGVGRMATDFSNVVNGSTLGNINGLGISIAAPVAGITVLGGPPSPLANGQGVIGGNPSLGLVLGGQGSAHAVTIQNEAGTVVASVPGGGSTAFNFTNTVNAATGYQVNGAAASGNVLRGNGTNFVNATLAAADLSNGVTGSGAVALAASPTFTGTPAAPTAAVDTNTTQIATTAMVLGQAAAATPLMNGSAAVGTSTRYARADHVHPTDTSLASLTGANSFVNPSATPGQRIRFDSADASPTAINNQTVTLSNYNTTNNNYAGSIMFTSKDTGGTERSGSGFMGVFSNRSASMVKSDLIFFTRSLSGAVNFPLYMSDTLAVFGSSASASSPALKPSGTTLAVRLGDDSADAPISGSNATWSGFASIGTKIRAAGTAPALTSCGTSPAISGSDLAGEVTMGTGTPTGCVITFNAAYSSTPYCVVTWQATPLASQSYAVSTTAITLTQTATSSNKVNYMCAARSGG